MIKIGSSNNSVIFKEMDKNNQPNGKVIKLIPHEKNGEHSQECQHLKNEYKILKKLRHPNIIRVTQHLKCE